LIKPWPLKRVVSGGQTGVDQTALKVAKVLGLKTGGWMPQGFKTDEGPNPEFAKEYGLLAHSSPTYPPRTRLNVKISDGTLIMGDLGSPGCKLTHRYCCEEDRKFLKIRRTYDLQEAIFLIRRFIQDYRIVTLNVAGNRERTNPGISEWATIILSEGLKSNERQSKN